MSEHDREDGLVDYFSLSDFIRWAKEQGIPVGPGRGSGAGSIVSYCLHITGHRADEVSVFLRALSQPERVSMPDIDMDFWRYPPRRGRGLRPPKYGDDHVAQIVTFGTMAARGAIRDVGRALNLTYADCDADRQARFPATLHITLDEALRISRSCAKV